LIKLNFDTSLVGRLPTDKPFS